MTLEQRLLMWRGKIVWRRKQAAANMTNAKYYGDGGTIHGSTYIDIEVAPWGEIVGCWFRCQMLPFRTTIVTNSRAGEMQTAFAKSRLPDITGIELHESVLPRHDYGYIQRFRAEEG